MNDITSLPVVPFLLLFGGVVVLMASVVALSMLIYYTIRMLGLIAACKSQCQKLPQ